MNYLSVEQLRQIIKHDEAKRMKPNWRNVTRMYKFLNIAGDDMEVHVVACKCDKKRKTFVKEILRSSVDDPKIYIRDVAYATLAGYVVDWSPQGIGPEQGWTYHGEWSTEAYSRTRKLWKVQREVINPEAILAHPRFKYCAWNPACGDVLDYLKAYVHHPRIELLSKIGAGKFANKLGFIAQLEKDKNMLKFFTDHLDEIIAKRYGVDVIRMAYKRKITLADASERIDVRHSFRDYGLPLEVDAERALEYVTKHKTDRREYCLYLKGCMELGLNLQDTKVAFPKQFVKRSVVIADEVEEQRRRRKAERAREMDRQIKAVAEMFKRLERSRSAFVMVLPKRNSDLVREGKRLDNCLGDGHYAGKIVRGECIIAFIRKRDRPNVPFVAVEYSTALNRVTQCYMAHNQRPPKPVLDFADRVFKAA